MERPKIRSKKPSPTTNEMIAVLTDFIYPNGFGQAHKEVRQKAVQRIQQAIGSLEEFQEKIQTAYGYF